MGATCKLIKKTDLDILIEVGDKEKIREMIEMKERALENALDNMAYWECVRCMPDHEHCKNEASRVELLRIHIDKLKEALK